MCECASVYAHRLCVYVRVYVCCVSVCEWGGEGMSVCVVVVYGCE